MELIAMNQQNKIKTKQKMCEFGSSTSVSFWAYTNKSKQMNLNVICFKFAFVHSFIFPLNLTILLGQYVAVHIEINANKKKRCFIPSLYFFLCSCHGMIESQAASFCRLQQMIVLNLVLYWDFWLQAKCECEWIDF